MSVNNNDGSVQVGVLSHLNTTIFSMHIPMYEVVLHMLQQIDVSDTWPSSSIARQKVIESNTLVEHGGVGGTFTVGVLPAPLSTPASNDLFPGKI